MHTVVKGAIKSVLVSLILLAGGVLLYFLIDNSRITLEEALLWAGFTPAICIALGMLGVYFGRADTAYQIGRRAFTFQAPTTNPRERFSLLHGKKTDLLSWILGGQLVCAYSTFLTP